MFGKLFGRSRKSDGQVLESGLPGSGTADVQVVSSTTGEVDLSALLHTVKEARDHAGGDPMKLMTELQQTLGGSAINGNLFTMTAGGMTPFGPADTVGQLERLAKLHADGALTDAEFAIEKAKLIGPGPAPAA